MDLKAGKYGSEKAAAEALHNHPELRAYAKELGIEFWAVIDKGTHNISQVSTGFSNQWAVGVTDAAGVGDSIWHTHPDGLDIWIKDVGSALNDHSNWIFASGKDLTGIQAGKLPYLDANYMYKTKSLTLDYERYNGGGWQSYSVKYK